MVRLPTADEEKKYEDTVIRCDRIHDGDGRRDGQTDRQTPHDGIGRAYA